MPRAGWVKPETDQRLSDHISLGVLTRVFPPDLVDRVVADSGRTQVRHRLLPARVVVYYVLALALFSQASYEEVMRNLVEGLSWSTGWARSWRMPSKVALSKARTRLGPEPLQAMFEAVAAGHRRNLRGRGRHPGERCGVRPARNGARSGSWGVSPGAHGGCGRVRDPCRGGRGGGALPGGREDAGLQGVPGTGSGDAAGCRPGFLQLRIVAASCANRR